MKIAGISSILVLLLAAATHAVPLGRSKRQFFGTQTFVNKIPSTSDIRDVENFFNNGFGKAPAHEDETTTEAPEAPEPEDSVSNPSDSQDDQEDQENDNRRQFFDTQTFENTTRSNDSSSDVENSFKNGFGKGPAHEDETTTAPPEVLTKPEDSVSNLSNSQDDQEGQQNDNRGQFFGTQTFVNKIPSTSDIRDVENFFNNGFGKAPAHEGETTTAPPEALEPEVSVSNPSDSQDDQEDQENDNRGQFIGTQASEDTTTSKSDTQDAEADDDEKDSNKVIEPVDQVPEGPPSFFNTHPLMPNFF